MPFEQNHLHYYLDLIRDEPYSDSGYSLFNILNTWTSSRNNRILNEDFSHIDFGYIPLNDIRFGDSEYPSSFNGATLNEENFASGHVGAILCSAISPNCKYVLTGSEDKTAILWDSATGFVHAKIEMSDRVDFVSFSDDSKECFIGAYRELPIVWNIERASVVYEFQELVKNTVFFKTNIKSVMFGCCSNVLYSNNKRYCVVYGVHKFKNWSKGSQSDAVLVLDMHKRTYTELYSDVDIGKITACSNDGRYVLTIKIVEKEILKKSDMANHKTYCFVSEVWDMKEGKMVFRSPIYEQIEYAAFSNDSRYVVLYEQYKQFSSDLYNYIVGIFDWKAGTELSKPTMETEHNWNNNVCDVSFSPDGRFVLSAYRYGYVHSILETDSWKRIADLGDLGRIYKLAVFSPDNRFCVVTVREHNEADDRIYVFDVLSDQFIKGLLGHSNSVTSLSFSDDSRLLVSTDSNNKCILWNTSEWNEIFAFGGNRIKNQYCVFLPKGELHELFDLGQKHQVIASVSSKSIRLWDAETRKKSGIDPLVVARMQCLYANYPIEIEEFYISGNKRFVNIIANPIKNEGDIRDLISFDMKLPNTCLSDMYCKNTPYAFSDDHRILATYTSKRRCGEYLTLIDLESNTLIYQAEKEYFREPNSRFLCVLFSYHNSFCFFDFGDNYSIFSLSDKTFKNIDVEFSVHTSVFSYDERFLLLGGYRSGTAALFDTDGNKLHEFHVKRAHIKSIGFSPNSKYCMLQSSLIVRIFDVENGEMVKAYTNNLWIVKSISGARFVSNNECLVYLSDGSVINWNFITGKKTKVAPKMKNKMGCPIYSDDMQYGISVMEDRIKLYDMSTRTCTDLYNVDGVNVFNCNFHNVMASEKLKAILYQNNADIEPPPKEPF